MATTIPVGILIAAILFPAVVVVCSAPITFNLERALPPHREVPIEHLRAHDDIRHGRKLFDGSVVVSFYVLGAFNPYLIGLYFTQIYFGEDEEQFFVQIDTGSDAVWIACEGCQGCPKKSGMKVDLKEYDPRKKNTSRVVECSDKVCRDQIKAGNAACNSAKNQCTYSFQYGDESLASGYYVEDMMNMLFLTKTERIFNSTQMLFGCTDKVTGDLKKSSRAVDGIFGLGRGENSVINQLASKGLAPYVFSHCLRGNDYGGGILVMGEAVHKDLVYTPLVKNQPRYNINLLSISVGDSLLPIDSSVFTTSDNQGTIVDSGTTLSYLAEKAYDPFLAAITNHVAKSANTFVIKDNQCYSVSTKLEEAFPVVTLHFEGGANMVLYPQDYLVEQNSADEDKKGKLVWCIGFQKVEGEQLTVLGDLVLKDKIVVYDLAHERIGWANYNCSLGVDVSETATGQKGAQAPGPAAANNSMKAAKVKNEAASQSAQLLLVGYIATMAFFALML